MYLDEAVQESEGKKPFLVEFSAKKAALILKAMGVIPFSVGQNGKNISEWKMALELR